MDEITPYVAQPDRDTINKVVAMFRRDDERRCVRIFLQWWLWDFDRELIHREFADVPKSTRNHYMRTRGPKLMAKFRKRLPPEIATDTRTMRGPLLLEYAMHALVAPSVTTVAMRGMAILAALPAEPKKRGTKAKWNGWTPKPSKIQVRLRGLPGPPRKRSGPGSDKGLRRSHSAPVLALHPAGRPFGFSRLQSDLDGIPCRVDDSDAVDFLVDDRDPAGPGLAEELVGRPSFVEVAAVEVDPDIPIRKLVGLADGWAAAAGRG